MRSKERRTTYRYFPDPDLLPLEFSQAYVNDSGRSFRNCPIRRSPRFSRPSELSPYDAGVLVDPSAESARLL